ncbi:MAG: hypothetical protein Q8R02_12905 [Hyphomonadaceae bacterium]|nr:hypothetical protein [Hyphomonadaceae bacterium]
MSKFTTVMKPFAAIGLLGLVLTAPGCAHSIGHMDQAQTEKELVALHDEWGAARISGDVAFLEKFYGQELRIQVTDGSVVERKDDIALFDRVGKGNLEVIKPSYIKEST